MFGSTFLSQNTCFLTKNPNNMFGNALQTRFEEKSLFQIQRRSTRSCGNWSVAIAKSHRCVCNVTVGRLANFSNWPLFFLKNPILTLLFKRQITTRCSPKSPNLTNLRWFFYFSVLLMGPFLYGTSYS